MGDPYIWTYLNETRFLWTGVVSSKLAQPLIQRKNGRTTNLCETGRHWIRGKWGGGILSPPKKQLIMRISDLKCFSDEYFSSFIYNSYVDTFFAWLKLAMIRQTFLSFEKRNILGEEGVSNTYKFLCGWLCSQNISNITSNCERFLIVFFILKI